MPTSLVTPTINVTLVCTIVSNPEVESVHWTSAVEGRAPSTVDEESRVSESGHYGQVTTTSTVVVLARGAEEQVRMGREVYVLCFQSLSLPLSHPSPIPLSSPPLPSPSPPLPLPLCWQYTYTCSASNALGEDQANVTVREGGQSMHRPTLHMLWTADRPCHTPSLFTSSAHSGWVHLTIFMNYACHGCL